MEILSYSYKRKGIIEFMFDKFPLSKVVFYPIKQYYFIKFIKWDHRDPAVKTEDLEVMQLQVNEFLGCLDYYTKRKAYNGNTRYHLNTLQK
ncbi:hypothetical protein [Metabacillus sediminilitoris]|uniref:Uncharacterized protein n=1 Tax=Metabacillus sediminilitoris TaxID=2567941 RepID=A0A4S4BVU4_9BACI|nr:hypothetical protein [Metabacillus sediminilitoris]QGQ46202.1 hypothetical protein GMB29_13830 [Metabacillus sediminilitoris]THF79255.1 hypothetical protein E6W99_12940 [Metabacillus sediminilitoris]